jgi:hypothetical protein
MMTKEVVLVRTFIVMKITQDLSGVFPDLPESTTNLQEGKRKWLYIGIPLLQGFHLGVSVW